MEGAVKRTRLVEGLPQAGRLGGIGGLILLLAVSSLQAALHDPQEVFPPGERLIYQVRWDPPSWIFFLPTITAGELAFQVHPRIEFNGRQVLKITVDAASSGFFLKVAGISVKDQFESLIDPKEFCSIKMTKLLREGKRQRDVYLTFDRDTRVGRYVVYDVSRTPRVELKNQELQGLPPCLQDVISAIYLTRLRDLRVGSEFSMIVCDDGVIKEVKLRITKRETVQAESGRYTALKVETFSVFGGLFRQGGSLVVWVNDDARRIPVRFEAKVKLGRVYGSLRQGVK